MENNEKKIRTLQLCDLYIIYYPVILVFNVIRLLLHQVCVLFTIIYYHAIKFLFPAHSHRESNVAVPNNNFDSNRHDDNCTNESNKLLLINQTNTGIYEALGVTMSSSAGRGKIAATGSSTSSNTSKKTF